MWLRNLPREDDEDPRRTIPCGATIGREETSGTITRNEGLRCFIDMAEKKVKQGVARTNPGSPGRGLFARTEVQLQAEQKTQFFLSERISVARSSRSGDPVSV